MLLDAQPAMRMPSTPNDENGQDIENTDVEIAHDEAAAERNAHEDRESTGKDQQGRQNEKSLIRRRRNDVLLKKEFDAVCNRLSPPVPPAGPHRPQSVLDMGGYFHFHVNHNEAENCNERYDDNPCEQPQCK